jgi:regulator of protease activity HflC (stomatin/prohibitin superfamily)
MEGIEMRKSSSFAALIFIVILGIGGGLSFAMYRVTANMESAWIGVIAFVIAVVVSLAIKVADQWERVVILRLGKFRSLKGPGLFFIIPVIDVIPYWIDTRVITASFKAEKTLTKDTVPVDVDAVLFWKVLDPKKAALEDAMSMQAQAERERQARVILGDSERQVAEKFGEAAKTYANNPIALHLRAMNMLYEGLKQNATIVIVPSTAVETMQLGGIAGVTALTRGLGQELANKEKESETASKLAAK